MELFQIYAKWLSKMAAGAMTKNSINTKMTISQEPIIEIDPTLCQNQGCKIPLARSHWRVNIGGGRVKLAMRSPDRASAFPSSEFVIFQSFGRKNGKTPT